jgi:hypothetical protein
VTITLRRSRLLAASTFALVLTGAALPSVTLAQGGPEEPVRGLFAAFAEKRFDEVGQYFCPEFADQAASMDLGAAIAGNLPANVDPQVAQDAIAFSITGPDGTGEPILTVGAEDPNGTPVGVDALLTAGLDPENSQAFVEAIVVSQLEAAGMEVTDENIAAFMTLVEGQLSGLQMFSQPIQTELIVSQGEDGSWLICSPLMSAPASADPGASPAA